MDVSDTTEKKQGKKLFQPGQSGNPAGRPKGSRNRLSERFIQALHDDFMVNGQAAIETVRTERPQDYLKIIASIVPKEFTIKDQSLDDMSDDELIELLAAVRSIAAANAGKETGVRARKATGKAAARAKLN